MTLNPAKLAQLDTIHLDNGGHSDWDDGHCAMEVVAWLADLGHTDAPSCASPVLRAYTIRLNDRLPDADRQRLKPYLPRMVGTAGDGQDTARLAIAQRALTEDLLPAWLRLAGMDSDAEQIATMSGASRADLRAALRGIGSRAWDIRQRWREKLAAKIREHLADRPVGVAVGVGVAAGVAAGVADAVAVAVADAVAAAVAVGVADAAGDAAAAADAVAVAAGDAVAAADGVAVADAVAAAAAAGVAVAAGDADAWSTGWNAAYEAAKPIWRKWVEEADAARPVRELAAVQRDRAFTLLDQMIDPAGLAHDPATGSVEGTMTYVYLDCETTGLDPARHEIWEIAYAVDDGPIQSSAVWHEPPVVSPDVRAALRVNGYLDRCRLIPQSDSEYWEDDLKKLLDGATLVGANPAFDAAMLRARWGFTPWHYRLLDIEAYAKGVLGLDHVPSLTEICERLDIKPADHTAANDVRAVREAYQTLTTLRACMGTAA